MKTTVIFSPTNFGSPCRKATENAARKALSEGVNGQFWTVPTGEFNALYKSAKEANLNNPVTFAFNRLHNEGKTKRFI